MLHLYRSISCKKCATLPASVRVLTFRVAMIMSSLPRSLCSSSTLVIPALVSDGERGRCAGPRPIRYGYSIIRCWCVLGISLVRRCPLLSRLQVWARAFMSVAWPTGVQLLVFFCSSVPVVLFDTQGISRCRSQHISVESSSLLHHSIYL